MFIGDVNSARGNIKCINMSSWNWFEASALLNLPRQRRNDFLEVGRPDSKMANPVKFLKYFRIRLN